MLRESYDREFRQLRIALRFRNLAILRGNGGVVGTGDFDGDGCSDILWLTAATIWQRG